MNAQHIHPPDSAHEVAQLRARIAELEADSARHQHHATFLQTLLDSLPQSIFWKDRDLVYQGCNQAFARVAGVDTPEQIVGKTDKDLPWKPEEADFFRQVDTRVMERDQAERNIVEPQLQADGKHAWLNTSKIPLHDEAGQVIGMLGTFDDITEQKQTELERDHLFSLTPDLICIAGFDGYFKRLNPAWSRVLGWTADELSAQPFMDFVHPDDRQSTIDAAQNLAEGQTIIAFTNRYRCKDGSYRWIEWVSRPVVEQQRIYAVARDITERKQAEQELRIFKTLVESAPDGIAVGGPNGTLAYVNASFRAMLGCGDEVIGRPITEIISEADRERLPALLQQTYEQGIWQGIIDHRRQDGTAFPTQTSVGLILQADGTPFGVGAVIRDITEQVQRELELEIFKLMAEYAPDALGMAPSDGTIVYANPAYRALTGYGDALIGMNFLDHFSDDDRPLAREALTETAMKGDWQGVLTFTSADGEPMPIDTRGFAIRDEHGTPIMAVGHFRDMRERLRKEDDLRTFNTVIETAPDGISIAALDGTITYANPALQALMGYDEALIGMNFFGLYDDVYHKDVAAAAEHVIAHGSWTGDLLMRRSDGQQIPIQTTSFVIHDSQGQPVGMTGMFRDLTEQRRAEAEREALQQQVIDAQRDALRELSTPLIPITDHVVIMPLIGTIDTQRAQQVMETLLEGVAQYQADLVILDITGVAVVDTQVAQAFIQAAQAVKLLGAQVMLTGIQPQIAQTLVHLGVDLSGIQTRGSLQAGIATALRYRGGSNAGYDTV